MVVRVIILYLALLLPQVVVMVHGVLLLIILVVLVVLAVRRLNMERKLRVLGLQIKVTTLVLAYQQGQTMVRVGVGVRAQ
jgi:hypothetical protein